MTAAAGLGRRRAYFEGVRRVVLAAVTVVALLAPARGAAQCTSVGSSCLHCHEAQARAPVLDDGKPWHADHAFTDLCVACHAGSPEAVDEAGAHRGLVAPLADVGATCGACHAGDAVARGEQYARAVAATGAARGGDGDGHGDGRPAIRVGNVAVASTVVVLGAVIAILLWRDRRRVPLPRASEIFSRREWPAAVAGALLGVVGTVALAVCGRPLSASGAFDRIAAFVGRELAPASTYYRFVVKAGLGWQATLLVGVLLGSAASAYLAGTFKLRTMPDSQWIDVFGPRRATRWLVVFFGTALAQFAAATAGGCTSGLAISGGILLAPAAFLFMAGMFGGGIPTAWLVYRKHRAGA